MARRCTICIHPRVVDINRALLENVPYSIIANRYGVHLSSVYRHRRNHLVRAVEEAERQRFERDVEQASLALKAVDEAIEALSGRTDRDSIDQLIRLIELKQSLLGKDKRTEELQIVWGNVLES